MNTTTNNITKPVSQVPVSRRTYLSIPWQGSERATETENQHLLAEWAESGWVVSASWEDNGDITHEMLYIR